MELIRKYWKYALIVIVSVAVGFFAGRWNTDNVAGVKFLKGEPIHDSIEVPTPYEVKVPANPVLPTKPDTVILQGGKEYIALKVDTAKIIAEYSAENLYDFNAFDSDTIGTMRIKQTLQYNKMKKFSYDFTPVKKVVTVERKRVLMPFVEASYSSFNYVGIGGGLYINNVGVSAKYVTDFVKKGFEIGLHYKF